MLGLDPAQREAVTSDAQPLCILAGAGSGKTRVLTRRIGWRVATGRAEAPHVLALTFTRRAAAELRSRLEGLGVRPQVASGTFHAVAYAQLRRQWADRGEPAPALLDRKARILGPLLDTSGVVPADVAAEIEWAKARLVRPDGYPAAAREAGRRPPVPVDELADLYARYEREKQRRRLVDFDDLLLQCADRLENDPEFAAVQRWRFRHLLVDEFQDVNPAQHRLLRLWLGERADLCVVGDPNQAIYGWNGADLRYLAEFGRWFPGATVVRLDHNYRSSPRIVAVAGAVGGGRPLTPHAPEGPAPTITAYPTDRAEAAGVARALRRARGGRAPWSGAAVLTRTHAQLVLFEESLQAAGIPFRVRGGTPFLARPEIRAALDDLRRRPGTTPLVHAVADLAEAARGERSAEAADHLDTLVRLAAEHLSAEPDATTEGFAGWLRATLRADDPGDGGDAVELATLHAAKGLEWEVVFLAGLEHGFLPIGHATTAPARAEERRLLYVGVTRARHELHLSWAERRTLGGRTVARAPSPYLERVAAALASWEEGGAPADWRRHLAEGRRRMGPEPGLARLGSAADPRVLEALRQWRADTARAACVPAHVVLHDTTLAAVAEARPADRDALLALPGVGPVKLERYGEALLSVVAATG